MMASRPPRADPDRPSRKAAVAVLVPLVLGGCSPQALDPAGRGADRVATLTWVMGIAGLAVLAAVLAVLAVAVRSERPRVSSTRLIVGGGIIVPLLVTVGLVGLTVWVGNDLTRRADDALVIEVTGHQYWWDVRYPDRDVRTANEVHLPVGVPVELHLRSADVIHSFWVPRLAGKLDLVPGRTNHLTVQADQTGRLAGYCAEFCGIQHANMRLDVVVHEAEAFDRWIAEQAEPAVTHTAGPLLEGQEVFLGSSCVYCHRVAGTNASSEVGPDLTHLMSRERIGAGVVPNTSGHMAGWILDPQHLKPGNRMPATVLSARELEAMIAYLEALE